MATALIPAAALRPCRAKGKDRRGCTARRPASPARLLPGRCQRLLRPALPISAARTVPADQVAGDVAVTGNARRTALTRIARLARYSAEIVAEILVGSLRAPCPAIYALPGTRAAMRTLFSSGPGWRPG
jgi:hypothetical protein